MDRETLKTIAKMIDEGFESKEELCEKDYIELLDDIWNLLDNQGIIQEIE